MNEFLLIVDDQEINRDVLRLMFENKYNILEACNGEECITIAREYGDKIILTLLDLRMPDISGLEILKMRQKGEILQNTPVIVITVQDNSQSQVDALRLEATDYIVKPFIKEVVEYRVRNAIEVSKMMRRIAEERKLFQKKSERDLLTGLYNKIATEERIATILNEYQDREHALFIFDLDDFKQVNDTYGHDYGDKCLRGYADLISSLFRSNDIIGRFGGDEFIVFMHSVRDKGVIERKLVSFFTEAEKMEKEQRMTSISVGYVMTNENRRDYHSLFRAADKALYQAKTNGKNQSAEYQGE